MWYVLGTDSVNLLVLITKEHVLGKTVSSESINLLIGRLQSLAEPQLLLKLGASDFPSVIGNYKETLDIRSFLASRFTSWLCRLLDTCNSLL